MQLGRVYVTEGVVVSFPNNDDVNNLAQIITRHQEGDWGDTCNDDKKLNEAALKNGGRIVSKYKYKEEELFVITEADRSLTTMMLTGEY